VKRIGRKTNYPGGKKKPKKNGGLNTGLLGRGMPGEKLVVKSQNLLTCQPEKHHERKKRGAF